MKTLKDPLIHARIDVGGRSPITGTFGVLEANGRNALLLDCGENEDIVIFLEDENIKEHNIRLLGAPYSYSKLLSLAAAVTLPRGPESFGEAGREQGRGVPKDNTGQFDIDLKKLGM